MTRQELYKCIAQHFPHQKVVLGDSNETAIIIKNENTEFGDIRITHYEGNGLEGDEDEYIVHSGHFTHTHFDSIGGNPPIEITRQHMVEFIAEIVTDNIGFLKHRSGNYSEIGEIKVARGIKALLKKQQLFYFWSGKIIKGSV